MPRTLRVLKLVPILRLIFSNASSTFRIHRTNKFHEKIFNKNTRLTKTVFSNDTLSDDNGGRILNVVLLQIDVLSVKNLQEC